MTWTSRATADTIAKRLYPTVTLLGYTWKHGHDLLLQRFTVTQVVHDYGDVCQAIPELAVELNAPISTDDFRMLNRCLDDAIAGVVTEYGREHTESGIEVSPHAGANASSSSLMNCGT